MKNNKIVILTILSGFFLVGAITFVITLGQINRNNIEENTMGSGVVGSTVYVNDALSDYYYYTGLNYTSGTSLPSGENQNIYNDNNLVKVNITYSGLDPTNSLKGYVSTSEMQDTYIYYKVYPIENNGTSSLNDDYVLVELIDNPFTNRPNNRGFNGWISLDNKINFSLDVDYYTRYAKVPITYTNGSPDTVSVTFNASWTPARVSNINGNVSWSQAFNGLKDFGMQKIEPYEIKYEDVDMDGYYHIEQLSRWDNCSGMYNESGVRQDNFCYCSNRNGCTYYSLISNEVFDPDNSYYELLNNRMTIIDNNTIERPIISEGWSENFNSTSNMAGYFRKKEVTRGQSITGLYDSNGEYFETGTCNSDICRYYELIKYYKESGEEETVVQDEKYFYLSTRDTNIIFI